MKKVMGLWDVVFMNVTAIIGLRWLPFAAGYGASSITLWVLAAVFFLIPVGIISSELATTWPDEGGLYVWVKEAYGEKKAFYVSWFYWANSFFYCPSLLTFLAVTLAFVFKPELATNKHFICSLILFFLWAMTIINIKGLRFVKKLSNLGGTCGILLPGVIIIALGCAAVFIWHRPIPTDYSFSHWLPNFGFQSNIALLSTLMFSMAGIELTPILAGETVNPKKTFPRAILISSLLIVAIYIIGTMSMTWIIAPEKIGTASGIMDAVHLIAKDLNIPFIATFVALLITIGTLGGASVWVVAPIKMFFESAKKGILPASFTKLNKNDMPSRAIIFQSIIVSIVVIGTSFLPSVNMFYETLVLMATITYFFPYLAMFMTFLKLRKTHPHVNRPYRVPGGAPLAWIMSTIGFCSVLLAIILPFIVPPQDVITSNNVLMYRIEIALGPIVFFILGYLMYAIYEHKQGIGKKFWLQFLG